MREFTFKTLYSDPHSRARLGIIHTPHGDIETPAFVPVGTQASVKSMLPNELTDVGTQLFFVNTYHMYLRPGIDIVKQFGGLHAFMHWDKPLITDSGGFQVFSLARNRLSFPRRRESDEVNADPRIKSEDDRKGSLVKISEDGVQFQSHWDGSTHVFTPEKSMEWQWGLGSDIHIAFDDCTAYPVSHDVAKSSMERTHRWAKRSLEAHTLLAQSSHGPYQALYGSVQGSVFEDLRTTSASYISSLDVDGIAIGGVSVGESKQEMAQVLGWVMPKLPDDTPRHLLGVGEIDDIFTAIESGVDTFDCVQPTRLARMGWVFSRKEPKYILDITKSRYANDRTPIDCECTCQTCAQFTRGYLYHLFHVKELLAYRLATLHNLHVMHTLVSEIRGALRDGTFLDLKRKWVYDKQIV